MSFESGRYSFVFVIAVSAVPRILSPVLLFDNDKPVMSAVPKIAASMFFCTPNCSSANFSIVGGAFLESSINLSKTWLY